MHSWLTGTLFRMPVSEAVTVVTSENLTERLQEAAGTTSRCAGSSQVFGNRVSVGERE